MLLTPTPIGLSHSQHWTHIAADTPALVTVCKPTLVPDLTSVTPSALTPDASTGRSTTLTHKLAPTLRHQLLCIHRMERSARQLPCASVQPSQPAILRATLGACVPLHLPVLNNAAVRWKGYRCMCKQHAGCVTRGKSDTIVVNSRH